MILVLRCSIIKSGDSSLSYWWSFAGLAGTNVLYLGRPPRPYYMNDLAQGRINLGTGVCVSQRHYRPEPIGHDLSHVFHGYVPCAGRGWQRGTGLGGGDCAFNVLPSPVLPGICWLLNEQHLITTIFRLLPKASRFQQSILSCTKMGQGLEPESPRPTRGYAHLAEFMSKTRHGMIRRYKDLSILNLLYLQAELYQLKFELDRETEADAKCPEDDERSDWDYHWRLLATSGQRTEGKRWQIWLKIREKMYEYRECAVFVALSQLPASDRRINISLKRIYANSRYYYLEDALQRHSNVASMAGPTNDQRSVLAKIVGTDDVSDGTFAFFSPELLGMEPEVYTEKFLDDLVLLEATAEENDILERFGARSMLRLLRTFGGCRMVS